MQSESYEAILRPGNNTGVGTTYFAVSPTNGAKTFAPYRMWQDDHSYMDKMTLPVAFGAAPTAGAYAIYVVKEGIWQVDDFYIYQRVAGTSPTFDLLWVANGTAIGSGTTQLTAVIDGSSAGNNLKYVNATLIATPTQAGPGNILGFNIGGTTTSFVGTVFATVKRMA